jgi:hypothetical protein
MKLLIQNASGFENELISLKKDLEAQLSDEKIKRDALSKLSLGDKKKKDNEQMKLLEVEIMTSDRLIAKIKGTANLTNRKSSFT